MSPVRVRHLLVAGALALAGLGLPIDAAAAQDAPEPAPADGVDLTPTDGVTPDGGPVSTPKATSSALAATDPDLLARTDGARIPVLVKLDYDAIAVYGGGLRGLPATSPSVTGEPLTSADVTTSPYAEAVADDEAAIVAGITAAVPSATIGQSLRTVYGGVAATIPASAVEALLDVPGVVAVHEDSLQQPLTDATPAFIGADDVWTDLGGAATAGSGVLFASIDSGLWPEHPSFADTGATPPRPTNTSGGALPCTYGDNPLTAEADVFACNDKLVGGKAFQATYDAQVTPDPYPGTGRDVNGHGTHTATTAAGNPVASAVVGGVDRGPISGVAPGAWVIGYKVCGEAGCYDSDSAAAVAQAILDGVDVINFSVSGGVDPATDVVELAFLDAYAAGVFVAASAGNDGPTTGTVNHNGPWTTTVAASTPARTFSSTLTVTGTGGATLALEGTNIGVGSTTPLPIVSAAAAPYANPTCSAPAPAGLFTGKVVVCERGPGRVAKSANVRSGGAAAMVLYNPTPNTLSAETFHVPTIHLASGTELTAFLTANPGATAAFTAGVVAPQAADQVARFSSRGPGDLALKPDVAAPGTQVLAGHTPGAVSIDEGPSGALYRAIDGTSMAAPHVAGAGLLLRALHPDWTPGQLRSALMGTATTAMTTEDGTTPATPFDRGAGRLRIDAAAEPGLLLDETAARFTTLGTDPAAAVQLNVGSINAPTLPGRLAVTRTVTNPGAAATYTAATTVAAGSTITVEPATFTLAAGASLELEITIETSDTSGAQSFGAVSLTAPGRNATRWPVAFRGRPGDVTITEAGCAPASVPQLDASTCEYLVQSEQYGEVSVDLRAEGDAVATVTDADLGATTVDGVATVEDVTVQGRTAGVPAIAPGATPAGYLPLDAYGVTPRAIGDEEFLNYDIPAFTYNGTVSTRIGITSNGYVVVGGATAADNNCCNVELPGPARPNDVLAPFWTDLDGTGAPGIFVGNLTDGVKSWVVVEWRVNVFGTTSLRTFQAWIGAGDTQDISFTYPPGAPPAAPGAQPVAVGAENRFGDGAAIAGLPTTDLRVTSTDEEPGAPLSWKVTATGATPGTAAITAEATTPTMAGSSVASSALEVTALPAPVVTTAPSAVSVDARSTASFSAAATGGTLVRWEQQAAGAATWTTVAGATTSPLTFTARGDQTGTSYRAVFANAVGTETATSAATLTVARLATSAELTASPAAPVRGQDVSFTVALSPTTASGTVQFAVDGAPAGNPVPIVGGSATSAPVSGLTAGTHDVTVTYGGDVDHLGTDADEELVVARATSSTSVVDLDPDVIVIGDTVLVDVTVAPAPVGGTVRLAVDGTDVGEPFAVDPTTGAGTGSAAGIGVGPHTVTATFSGDDDLDPSTSAAAPFTVTKRSSTTSVTVTGPDTPGVGDAVAVAIQVTPVPVASTVQLRADGADVGSPLALDAAGRAVGSIPGLGAGLHQLEAVASGDDVQLGSTGTTEVTVLATDDAFVRRAFVEVLGRPADPGGLAYWVQVLGEGVPEEAMVAFLAASNEGRGRVVDQAYQRALGRAADPTGRAHWVARLNGGLSADDLLATLLGTGEGYARAGGTTDGFTSELYQLHLDRAANAGGLAYWRTRVAAATTPAQRRVVALAFGRLAEVTRVAVARIHTDVCGDEPLAPELATTLAQRWVGSGRHPLRQAGATLALACAPGTRT